MKLLRVMGRPVPSKSGVMISVAVICFIASLTEWTCGSCISNCNGRYGSNVIESLFPGFLKIDRRLPVNIRVIGDSTINCYQLVDS